MPQTNQVSRERNRRILVVDDVATNLRLVQGHLRREGYRVLLASSGEEALDSIRDTPPDLVLLDVIMPGLDGFETCRRIRRDRSARHVPIILLTSLNDLDHKVEGQKAGADDFITKPFDRNELLIRVRSLLRLKALHDRLTQKIEELESAKVRLRLLADTDSLTSLRNKRYLTRKLQTELERANRYKNPLSLVMVDVDFFKRINDKYGHLTGDAVLQQMATLFLNGVRGIDLVARYGGEEFAIVLPETNAAAAVLVAERLRADVAKKRFLDAEGVPIDTLTISLGVAGFGADTRAVEQLIKLADSRLYEAKQCGRNRVVGQDAGLAVSVQE